MIGVIVGTRSSDFLEREHVISQFTLLHFACQVRSAHRYFPQGGVVLRKGARWFGKYGFRLIAVAKRRALRTYIHTL